MFPFSCNKRIIITSDGEQEIDTEEILRKFEEQFDNPGFKDQATITFDNFNLFLKRHSWLSSGVLKITRKDNQVFADLSLGFYTTPVILALLSIGLVAMNTDHLWFALFGITAFWIFYALLYLWTITMFVMTIKRTIRNELLLKQSGLDSDQRIVVVKDICPGCGNNLKVNEIECSECGLYFGESNVT